MTTTTGTIAQVNPNDLTVGNNVRRETSVTSEFVNSIKEHGILQPPMVTDNGNGGYEIVLGHRRTLGAIQAGLTLIDVYVVPAHEAEAARLIDQLTENDQRQQITEAERVGGYIKLALLDLSPAQIARRTAVPRKTIDTALAVGNNETANQALTEYQLTLDQAAYLVEFSDDPKAITDLVKAAETGQLDHTVARLRREKTLAQDIATLIGELTTHCGTVLPFAENAYVGTGDDLGWTCLDQLGKITDPTIPLEPADVRVEWLAGRAIKGWDDGNTVAKAQYFVLDAETNGYPRRAYVSTPRELTPEEIAKEEQRRADEQARAERRATLNTAAEVRRAWVQELMQRNTLPKDALTFVTRYLANETLVLTDEAFTLVGMDRITVDDNVPDAVDDYILRDKNNALRLLLATALAAAELEINPQQSWRGIDFTIVEIYLRQLKHWGYGLSDIEEQLLAQAIEESAATRDDDGDDTPDNETEHDDLGDDE